jgi:hypothetical protein
MSSDFLPRFFSGLFTDGMGPKVFYAHRFNDRHLIPASQEEHHQSAPYCWCGPDKTYEDLITRGRVFTHHIRDEPGN